MNKPDDVSGFRAEELAGQRVAVMGRSIASVTLAVLVTFLVPWPIPVYYYFAISVFLLIGWAAYWIAALGIGKTWHQYAFVTADSAWFTFAIFFPNPLAPEDFSNYLPMRAGVFVSFFLLLAGLTYLYQAWLVIWCGVSTSVSWLIGVWWLSRQPETVVDFLGGGEVRQYLQSSSNPYFLDLTARVWEIAMFMIVACLLALVVHRAQIIALRQVTLAKQKTNLARYFPTHTAALLADKSELLTQPREHNAAVLFVDIVDFTGWSQKHTPTETIELLREVQELLTNVVFRHHGTLDKYLGDGLMATFGTPEPGHCDATNALSAAFDIAREFEHWRKSKAADATVPTKLAIGVHYGPIVIGDVGTAERMEFAVLGDTVNVASRLEQATRQVGCTCLMSVDLLAAAEDEAATDLDVFKKQLKSVQAIELRGRTGKLQLFSLSVEDQDIEMS